MPGYNELVNFPVLGPGTTVTTTTIADVSPVPQFSIPAGSLTVGSSFRVTAYGRYTTGTTATNITLGVYYGGVAGLALATTGAVALTISQTNAPWRFEYVFTVRSTGTSGTAFGHGFALIGSSVSALGSALPMPNTANAAVTIDTTTAKNLTVGLTLSQITGPVTATCDHVLIERLATVA